MDSLTNIQLTHATLPPPGPHLQQYPNPSAKIAGKLKRRLEVRKEQFTKQTVACKGLSEFMLDEISGKSRKNSSFYKGGTLDALSAGHVTDASLIGAANLAIRPAWKDISVA